MKKSVIYCRTSTELQEKEQTILSQIQVLLDYAKEHDYEIIEQYLDDGWSGTLLARPALDRLRDDASKKYFDSVLIYDPDRLARKFAYQALVMEELEELNIELVFLNRPKAETPEDKVLQGFQGLFAEYERTKIIERTRRGKLHKVKSGHILGNEPPYGYLYIPKTKTQLGKYEINEQEAEVIRQIYQWVSEDKCSLLEVRRRLNENKVITRSGNTTIWQNSTLSRLLRNETYIGTTYWNKTVSVVPEKPPEEGKYKRIKKSSRKNKAKADWIPISVPAILEKETFSRVQEQLKQNLFFCKRNQKYHYLLSGLLFCGECGSRFVGDGFNEHLYYRCTNRIHNFPLPKTCSNKSIRADLVEPLVWNQVCDVLNDPKSVMEQLTNQNHIREQKHIAKDEEYNKIEAGLANLTTEEERFLNAYRKEVIDIDSLKEQMTKINEERKQLEERKEVLSETSEHFDTIINPETVLKYCDLIKGRLPGLDFEHKRELLRLILDQVIVKAGELTVRGILPTNDNDSQNLFGGDSRIGERIDNSRSGCIVPFPSIIHNSRNSIPRFEVNITL